MPINPITLDKIDNIIIKQIENKVVDRIVHEARGAEIRKESNNKNNNFSGGRQEQAAQQFSYFLSKFNIKLEYKILKDKVKVRIKDKNDNLLIETEVDDVEDLFNSVRKETGAIIDLKG